MSEAVLDASALLALLNREPGHEEVAVISNDPTDNRILECALATDAELVVTEDKKHLPPLGTFQYISIVGLRDFLAPYSAD